MSDFKPTTPSRRHMTRSTAKKRVTKGKPHKALVEGFRRGSGRNNAGRITTRHKGGGHKRKYRTIGFSYDKKDIPAKIESIEYDPNRTSYIALVVYADGERRYVIAPQNLEVGDEMLTSQKAKVKPGNSLPLKKLPVGTFVYNIEIKPGSGARLVRSAGTYAEVVARDAGYVTLKMPSSEIRKIHEEAWASVGEVSNAEHKQLVIGKAGRARHMGRRPTVRGTAMNPVDHPMGGGEARSRGQRPNRKTKQGKHVNPGSKTRKPKKYSNKLIVQRRKTKRRGKKGK
ncbi:MAG: 50S ribosomal protein L2 [Candidatus Paceibacterota bacterium]